MMERERINIILFGKSAAGGKVFYDALSNLELPHCIINLRSVNQTTSYLSSTSPSLPNVLIFYVSKPSNAYLIHIKIISEVAKYKNLSILIYDPTGSIDEEEAFAAGANMIMHKASDSQQLKIKLKHLFGMSYQYYGGNLSKETFFLSL